MALLRFTTNKTTSQVAQNAEDYHLRY